MASRDIVRSKSRTIEYPAPRPSLSPSDGRPRRPSCSEASVIRPSEIILSTWRPTVDLARPLWRAMLALLDARPPATSRMMVRETGSDEMGSI